MKLTKRDIWILHYLLDFHIHRYMMCNAKNRIDAHEKADEHIAISKSLCMFILCEGSPPITDTYNVKSSTMSVHDYLADILTDRMDKVIGFPTDRDLYGEDFKYFGNLFFNVIIDHIIGIKAVVKRAIKGERYR